MALLETKIIQVSNSTEVINSSNEERGSFGWSVQNVQVTHSQDTRTYTKGLDYLTGDKTVETTTINYATITYQRDKKMPNYERITALEREYDQLAEQIVALQSEIKAAPSSSIGIVLLWCFVVWPYGLYRLIKWFMTPRESAKNVEERNKQVKMQVGKMIDRREAVRREAESLL